MDRPWETCAVIHGHSWIWNGGKDVKSFNMCMRMLIDCAGGDGNLLLNFGPTPEGEIIPSIVNNYRSMGKWLKKYGQTIYKTRGGPYKPGLWGVSTRRDKKVFLHITQKWPIGLLKLPAFPAKIISCKSLTGGKVQFKQTDKGLEIKMDPKDHAYPDTIVELTIDKDSMTIEPIPTLKEHTLTVDAKVSASSSVNPRNKRGAAETVVNYSFEQEN